jgi:CRP-like cAMP-binding protein
MGHEMYYILAGNIRMEKRAGQVKKILAEFGPGEYFGEMAALIDVPRTASAYATEYSNIAVIAGETFRSLLKASVDVSFFMLKEFSNRIINTNVSLEELTQVWIKLVMILYFLKEWPLKADADHLAELARYTGKDQAEIVEVLAELANQGVLTMQDNRVTGFSKEQAWNLWSRQLMR